MQRSDDDNAMGNGSPSPSAVRTATARAVHQLLDDPIVFEDPLALPILGRGHERAVREDPFRHNDPAARTMRAAIVARSRLAEDELQKAVGEGVRQFVVLGAGLDTFAYRNPYNALGLQTYEVDQPPMQHWKRTRLDEACIPIPDSLTFVGTDFETGDSLSERLREAGFRWGEPACFSWLGVTPYLTDADVLDVLATLSHSPAGSRVVFDYRLPTSMLEPLERMMEEHVAELFAAMGEPWRSSFEPVELQHQLGYMGFTDLENLGPAALNERFFPRRKDGLQTGGGGLRMLCARRY
ncbi:class I SAM-dependent methyltransferase [Arhodomonas sp. AD133]|uniref:class I SAM-dependent methyltransferase n=1 Tax=Arhodomonas sp. AD133 TaxID=3415009 RepID=UPI003EB75198